MNKLAKTKPVISKAIGRVVTNLVNPESYSLAEKIESLSKTLKDNGKMNALKAIIKDKPIYKTQAGVDAVDSPRTVLYKSLFGLPIKDLKLQETAKKYFTANTDAKGKVTSFALKPDTAPYKEVQQDASELLSFGKADTREGHRYHSLFGNYDMDKKNGAHYGTICDRRNKNRRYSA